MKFVGKYLSGLCSDHMAALKNLNRKLVVRYGLEIEISGK